jgi:hypothetical protein
VLRRQPKSYACRKHGFQQCADQENRSATVPNHCGKEGYQSRHACYGPTQSRPQQYPRSKPPPWRIAARHFPKHRLGSVLSGEFLRVADCPQYFGQNLQRNSWLGLDSLQDVRPHLADELVSFWRRHFVQRFTEALAVFIDGFDQIIGGHWVPPLAS